MSQLLIPGPVAARRAKAPVFLVVVWLAVAMAGIGYYLWHEQTATSTQPADSKADTQSVVTDVPVDPDLAEDTANHLQHARADLLQITEKMKRAQARIRQVNQELQQSYLEPYGHPLDMADMNCESALQSATRALQELDIAHTNVTKRRQSR